MTDFAGGSGDDVFTGGVEPDNASGGGGNDQLSGNGGNDTLSGDAGQDTLNGGDGNDTLNGGDGTDFLYGGDGDDTLIATEVYPWGEVYDGGTGLDTLEIGAGFRLLFGSTLTALDRIEFASIEGESSGLVLNEFQLTGAGVSQVFGGAGRDSLDLVVSGPAGSSVSATMPALTLTGWTESATPHLFSTVIDWLTLAGSRFVGAPTPNYALYAREGITATQTLLGSVGNDTLVGSNGTDVLMSLSGGADLLQGSGGNDVLCARNLNFQGVVDTATWAGSTFDGGTGSDIFLVGGVVNFAGALSSIEHIFLQPEIVSGVPDGSGSQAAAELTLGAAQMAALSSNLTLSGTGAITIDLAPGDSYDASAFVIADGSTIAHIVNGSATNDAIGGLQQTDTLYGNGGDDVLNGNDGDDALNGGTDNDVLNGGAGTDTLNGLDGNDWLYVDNVGDVLVEAAGGGSDRVFASVSYTLGAGVHVEILSTTDNEGLGAINLTGNGLTNSLTGNNGVNVLNGGAGADTLNGLGGNDFLYVDNAADAVIEAAGGGSDRVYASVSYALGASAQVEILTTTDNAGVGAINLTGNGFANSIAGNNGNNILNGGAGADTLNGLGGNDLLYVDNASDVIVEAAGGGTDRVFASVSYALGAAAQVEVLSTTDYAGAAAINLTGNGFANSIAGNNGVNVLNGGGGADALSGLGGDDFFYVDNAGDVVIEAAGGGTDRVYASVSYTLGAGSHVETLSTTDYTGTAAINLTGNGFANRIAGNNGVNVLNGGAGADTLNGMGGNDFYYVDHAGDVIFEAAGGGSDRVYASVSYALGAAAQVEILTTTDNAGLTAINLNGNGFANSIAGNNGANVLDGGAGADTLNGLGGADTFRFTTALGAGNVDMISGYSTADDVIHIDNAVFAGLAAGALAAGAFNTGTAASQADDRIIYNSATGALLFDADGVGGAAAVQFAALSAGLAMTAGEFVVI